MDDNDTLDSTNNITANTLIWRSLQGLMSVCVVVCGWFILELFKDMQDHNTRLVAIENSRWKSRDQTEYMRSHAVGHTDILKLLTTVTSHVNDDRMHEEARNSFAQLHRELNQLQVSIAEMRSDIKSITNGHQHSTP